MLSSLVTEKCNAIRATMRPNASDVVLTDDMRGVLSKFVTAVETSNVRCESTSETQKSSKKTERAVVDMLGVPEIRKTTDKKKKNVVCLPPFVDDCFGFSRPSVTHRNVCRFVPPESDGIYVIHTPYGCQSNPDVLLLDIRNKVVVCSFGIEVKSGGPTWNTHIQFSRRNLLYVAFKNVPHYFFGDHVRTQESWIYAFAWDELQRELAHEINSRTTMAGLSNLCVAYPKQEFRGLDLDTDREKRHVEIKAWIQSSG